MAYGLSPSVHLSHHPAHELRIWRFIKQLGTAWEKVLQRIGLIWKKSTHCKSNVGNFIFANTMPWELDDYFKAIGITNVFNRYYSPLENEDKVLEYILQALENGEMPILMENHLLTADRHKNLFYKIFGAHFITVHGFKINNDCNTISLSYWDYGSVKNYREQSVKGSPLTARSLNAAIRRNNRLNKIKEDSKNLEITRELFFKGLKGYWIPNNTATNNPERGRTYEHLKQKGEKYSVKIGGAGIKMIESKIYY